MLPRCLLGLALTALGSIASADTLLLDGVEMAAATAGTRPARGQTMTSVEERYGTPTAKMAAVGEPPISRWEYPQFTVFFEFDRVIHAVPRR